MCYSSIGIEIGDGNIIWNCRDIERVLVLWMLYSFAIIIITVVGVDVVLGKGFVTGILYSFDIDNGGNCYRNLYSFFGNDNNKFVRISYILG